MGDAGSATVDIVPEVGSDFERKLTRDVNGRLRNAQGQFVKGGQEMGRGMGDGVGQGLAQSSMLQRVHAGAIAARTAMQTSLLGELGGMARDTGRQMTMGLTLPLVGIGVAATAAAISWESAFAGVTKTVDGTDAQLAELGAGIRQMATEMPASANEIAAVAEAAGQLGIQRDSILSFSRTMIDLGETTNLTADQAATALAQLANITQMSQDDFDRLGSAIVAVGNAGASTESEITDMSLRIAGAGAQIGMTEADIVGLSSALASVGIDAEAGGSAISRVMIEMAASVDEGGSQLEQFAQVAGMTSDEFSRLFQSDPSAALQAFVEGLGRAEASGQSLFQTIDNLGLSEIRTRDALMRLAGAGGLLGEQLDIANQGWEENTALQDEAAKRYETTAAQMEILRNRATEVGIQLGSAVLPVMTSLAGIAVHVAEGFAGLPGPIQAVVVVLGGLVAAAGPAIYVAGSLMQAWAVAGPTIVRAIQTIAVQLVGFAAVHPVIAGVVAVTAALGAAWAAMQMSAGTAEVATDSLTASFREQGDAAGGLEQAIRDLGEGNSDVAGADELERAMNAAGKSMEDLIAAAEGGEASLQAFIDDLVQTGEIGEKNRSVMEAFGEAVTRIGFPDDLPSGAERTEAAVLGVAEALAYSEEQGAAQAAVYDDMGTEAQQSADQIQSMKDAIDSLFGAELDAQSASLAYRQELLAIQAQVQEGTFSLDANTEAGLRNQQSLIGLTEGALSYASATFMQNGSIEEANFILGSHISQMMGVLQATGMAEGEAIQYIATMLGIPPDVATRITNTADLAEWAVQQMNAELGRTPRSTSTTMYVNTERGDFDQLVRDLEASERRRFTMQVSVNAQGPGQADGGLWPARSGGHQVTIAEAGHPEVIIPLDPSKRDRAMQLMQASGLDQLAASSRTAGAIAVATADGGDAFDFGASPAAGDVFLDGEPVGRIVARGMRTRERGQREAMR